MSPVTIDHEENSPSCHHCHITTPIPLSQLIKTHPLRSPSPDEEEETEPRGDSDVVARRPEANVQTNAQANAQANSRPNAQNGTLIQNLLEGVVNHEFHRRKKKSPLSTSEEEISVSNSLKREEPTKLVRPVHSFLHHVSDRSVYKAAERQPMPKHRDLGELSSSVELENAFFQKSERRSSSPDLILNVRTLIPHPEYANPVSRGNSANHGRTDNSSRLKTTTARERDSYSKVVHIKDTETQTSKTSSLSSTTFSRIRNYASHVSSVFSTKPGDKRERNCSSFACSLPSGLLFAGYGLLIVIGIVVAVALSQRERRIQQSSPLPRRPPTIAGARAALLPTAALSHARIAPAGDGGRRRLRPIVKTSPLPALPSFQDAKAFPLHPRPSFANAASAPAPAPSPVSQRFLDEDFDYLEEAAFNDADFLLPGQNAISKPAPKPAPSPQAFRPVEINPQFRAQAPAPAQISVVRAPSNRPQQQTAAPRRGIQPSFKQEFNLQQQPGEELSRGQKEPEVQIIKSWSNRNADGTFSWGYVNTDGTFKNETRGVDCVVRGVYGYIDETTGEALSFPYESGNPCDPNAPDYYFDYEDGTINVGGQVASRAQLPKPAARKRLQ